MKNFIQTYKFVPLKILIPIYDALFSTCIVYSLVVCSYTFTDNIEKLITLQKKKCLPLATFSNYLAHLTLIFNSLKIIQLDSILNFHLSTSKSSLLWCIKTHHIQMNRKDLSRIAVVKRMELQNTVRKIITTLTGIIRKLLSC